MDYQEQERKIYESNVQQYEWIHKNEYQKLMNGFVHDQNAKVKLHIQNGQSVFKIEQKLIKSGKNYEVNGTFHTWNIVPFNILSQNKDSFQKKLTQLQSVVFGTYNNNLKLQWRSGEKLYKNFRFNPFISIDTPKDLQDLNLTLGLNHKSRNLSLSTKLTASIINTVDFIQKTKIEYVKNQMLLGLNAQINPKLNFKINKSLLGYEFSPRDYFYLGFNTESLNQLVKGKQADHEVGFYYLRKNNENLKFAVGMKSVNAIDNTLNFVVETMVPYHIKGKIDSKLNACVTIRKVINDNLAFMYGIGLSNLFQKRSRVQTGLVVQYNA